VAQPESIKTDGPVVACDDVEVGGPKAAVRQRKWHPVNPCAHLQRARLRPVITIRVSGHAKRCRRRGTIAPTGSVAIMTCVSVSRGAGESRCVDRSQAKEATLLRNDMHVNSSC
jgi:hypothetical protein